MNNNQKKFCDLFAFKSGSLLFLLGFFCLMLSVTRAGESKSYALILNSDSEREHISFQDVRSIYLGKMTLWEDGSRVQPCMLREKERAMQGFIKSSLGKSVYQYRAYWKRKLFSGGGTVPKTFRTTKSLLQYVKRTPGAIGVISAGSQTEGVKRVEVPQ